jgi:hypothetical protein
MTTREEVEADVARLEALKAELREVGAVEFARRFHEQGLANGDYTAERQSRIGHLTPEDFVGRLNQLRRARGEEEMVWLPEDAPPV